MTCVLFAGGGTGGHLMPALAIAQAMVELDPTIEPLFVGGKRGIEATVLPMRPWRYELLPLQPLYRQAWWRNLGLPISAFKTGSGMRRILNANTPRLVVGTGGYVSGPVVLIASMRGVPVVIQEQNAFPGLTTRKLAGRADQVHLGFPEARGKIKPGKATEIFDSGNPITPPPAVRPDRAEAKRALGFRPDRPLVLIMGGSQGALAINRAVAEALGAELWPEGCQIMWQTGAGSHANYKHWYQPGQIRVEPFLDPIANSYAAADLVVARAGAMTIAELAAWGLPAMLIPLPSAAANHQLHNAVALEQSGAAVLLEQAGATGKKLATAVGELLESPARLAGLTRSIGERARPLAAREIASAALRLIARG